MSRATTARSSSADVNPAPAAAGGAVAAQALPMLDPAEHQPRDGKDQVPGTGYDEGPVGPRGGGGENELGGADRGEPDTEHDEPRDSHANDGSGGKIPPPARRVLGPPLPPATLAAAAARSRARNAERPGVEQLRLRAWGAVVALDAAGKPITVKAVSERARVTTSAALGWLHEWTAAGRLTHCAHAGAPGRRPAPYLDSYTLPTLPVLSTWGVPMPSPTPRPEAVSLQPFRVLVTGSRTWVREDIVHRSLKKVLADCAEHGQRLTVVHGACPRGVDAIAHAWALKHAGDTGDQGEDGAGGVRVEPHPADWDRHGRRAGFHRNTLMVAAGADLCLAFILDNSPGATHCATAAEAAGIPVHRCEAATPRNRGAAGTVRRDRLVPAALAYAARGWHIFPLRPDTKRPAFPDHPENKCDPQRGSDPRCRRARRHVTWEERATTDPARIRAAWSRAPYGIGIATGPSGLLVVDLDVPKPGDDTPPVEYAEPTVTGVRDGADVFALLCERAGEPLPWDTYTVHTTSGGTHLYYSTAHLPPDVADALRNTGGTLGWLIDTRGHGGYVVAPPSTADGRPYTHGNDTDAPAAPLPAWLAAALRPAPLPAQQPVSVALNATHDRTPPGGDRQSRYLGAAVQQQIKHVTTAPTGQRNHALYRSAVALGQLVAGGALTAAEVTTDVTAAAKLAGLDADEITRTIASGLRAGANRPRHLPAEGAAA
jgi:hypothetical protein